MKYIMDVVRIYLQFHMLNGKSPKKRSYVVLVLVNGKKTLSFVFRYIHSVGR